MGELRFELTRDVRQFARRAESFLAAKIERNVLATVLAHVLSGGVPAAQALFACGLDPQGAVRAAAVRTAPWPMLATDVGVDDVGALVRLWTAADPELPGISAQPVPARVIAATWAALTGGRTRCRMREAMHVLEEVSNPPRPAPGELRVPEPTERGLLAHWLRAFAEEAGVLGAGKAEELVDAQLAAGRLFVWDDSGPASMVSVSPTIARVTRIGPVYTPPDRRSHGYASSAVAAVSRFALAHGAERCALFTDLANPTSNKIYGDVGYRRILDWEEHAFERGEG